MSETSVTVEPIVRFAELVRLGLAGMDERQAQAERMTQVFGRAVDFEFTFQPVGAGK